MTDVLTAATTELFKLETFGCSLLVLRSHIVATLALCTLQYDIITRHKFLSPISNLRSQSQISDLKSHISIADDLKVETSESEI